MTQQELRDPNLTPDVATSLAAVLRAKFTDILAPGYEVEFDPDEAEQAGAFDEDALGEQDAAESCMDLVDPDEAPGRERESS